MSDATFNKLCTVLLWMVPLCIGVVGAWLGIHLLLTLAICAGIWVAMVYTFANIETWRFRGRDK